MIPPNKISKEKEEEIIRLYNEGKDYREIANNVKIHFGSIGRILRRRNVKIKSLSETHRTYSINENYFDIIDTPDKAYILGLLFADGCNVRWNESKKVYANEIKLDLNQKDKDILESIRVCIGSERPLVFRKVPNGNRWNKEPTYLLRIINKRLSERLEELGCVQNKTHILTFPRWLSRDLYPAFVRGYFDGDGSLMNTRSPRWEILSTRDFCSKIKEILTDIGINSSIWYHPKSNIKFYVRVDGRNQVARVCEWMYACGNLRMERKYQKYLETQTKK